jgi:hypothetical protein
MVLMQNARFCQNAWLSVTALLSVLLCMTLGVLLSTHSIFWVSGGTIACISLIFGAKSAVRLWRKQDLWFERKIIVMWLFVFVNSIFALAMGLLYSPSILVRILDCF